MSSTSKSGILAVCGSFTALSTIAVAFRFYGRRKQRIELGWDDWTALFGVITYIAVCGIVIELVTVLKAAGYGKLTPAQSKAIAKPTSQLSIAYDFLLLNTLACSKVSAVFLYRRLFVVQKRETFNMVLWATIIVIAAWYVTFDVLSCLQCRSHFSALWDGGFKKYCDLNPVWAKGLAVSDFLLDVWVLALPMPKIWRLRMAVANKLLLTLVFLMAYVGLGAAIVRIIIFVESHGASKENLYIGVLEAGISITVVNLPMLWSFIANLRTWSTRGSYHSRQRQSPNSNKRNGNVHYGGVARASDIPGYVKAQDSFPSSKDSRAPLDLGYQNARLDQGMDLKHSEATDAEKNYHEAQVSQE